MYKDIFKRVFDIIFTLIILVIISPLVAIISILIKINDGGKIIFKQERIGKDEKNYNLLKFRSMPESTKNLPTNIAGRLTVTPIGQFIRRTNIDEIPQFINVIKGEMSIIGPRPSLTSQDDVIELRRSKGIYELLPGLTGLAQVNSFDGMTAVQKVEYDEKYLKSLSFFIDFKIVLNTIKYFLKKPPTY